jgi:hypothetical protein
MPIDTTVETHAVTTRMNIHEVAAELVTHLGPTLVAILANVKDRKLPHRWAQAGGTQPNPQAAKRLLAAHRAWQMISSRDGDYVARSWFIGANPRLSEQEPTLAIREDRIPEVIAAAQAFVEDSFDA